VTRLWAPHQIWQQKLLLWRSRKTLYLPQFFVFSAAVLVDYEYA
jgi:hypothetical protein